MIDGLVMGEIFSFKRPDELFPFTGERFTNRPGGSIEVEHLHRYLQAREACRGKDVLDVASGEGYGSALLAQVARSVVGIELDPSAVAHASRVYGGKMLTFTAGDARQLPVADACMDVAVSFETLEHFAEHDQFLAEVRRVLRPDGVLILSTPDRDLYSPIGEPANHFHVRELSRDELLSELGRHFSHVVLLRQRVLVGSILVPDGDGGRFRTFEKRGPLSLESSDGLPRAKYLVALASNAPLDDKAGSPSVYLEANDIPERATKTKEADHLVAEQQVLLDEARVNEQGWRNNLASLSVELGSTRQRLLDQNAEITVLRTSSHALAGNLSAATIELVAARQEANRHEALIVELQTEVSRLHNEASATEQALAASRRQAEEWDRTGAAERAEQKALLRRLAAVQDELRDHEAAARTAEAKLDSMSSTLQAAKDEEAVLLAREAVRRGEVARLREQCHRADQQAVHLQRDLDQARLERAKADDRLRDELEAARRLLATRDAELDAERNRAASALSSMKAGHLHNIFVDRFLRWNQAYVLSPGLQTRRILKQARQASKRKRWRTAEVRYREVLNSFPRLRSAWVQYGHSLKEQGDFAAAYGAYGKALELGNRTADTFLHLGHAQRQLGLTQGAEHSLLQALRLRPSMPNLWNDLQGFERTESELVEAVLDHRDLVITTEPRFGLGFRVLLLRAQRAMGRQDWQQAMACYRKALVAAPNDARVWLLYGHALKEAGDRQGALRAYLQALVLDPLNHEPRLHLEPLRPVPEAIAQLPAPAPAVRVPDQIFVSLAPGQHLQSLPDGSFLTTGNDPQFGLHPVGGSVFPHGLVVLSIKARMAEPLLRPLLYVWDEGGLQTFPLPIISGPQTVQWTLQLPERVTALRLDPTAEAGVRFAIDEVTFHRRGALVDGEALPELQLAEAEYAAWVKLYDTLTPDDADAIRQRVSELPVQPLLSVVMPVYNPQPRYLRQALESVVGQLYPNWELCIADDASTNPEIRPVLEAFAAQDKRIKVTYRKRNGHISAASNSALELVSGEFAVLMDHDDKLAPHALYLVAEELNNHPDTDVIYSDEDKVDGEERRHDPHFKTAWNPDLFYSQNIVAHLGVFRMSLMRKIGGFRIGFEGSQDYDLVLRILGLTSPERIRHIPFVLYHWRIFPGVRTFSSNNPDKSVSTAHLSLVDHFRDIGEDVDVLPIESFPGWWRIRRKLPKQPPSVTLIIPTRDRVELVRSCVDGLLHGTDYPKLDVIIVDNGSVDPETLSYFDQVQTDARVRVVRVEGPFNYSTLNNTAVRQAKGDFIGFVNNDIEVMQPGWLAEMMSQAVRPGIGAVGAKLLYANGNIQHAGVTLGVYGVAAHGHRHYPANAIGYFGRPQLQQDVSAVTAAMLIMPRHLFNEIGGFDAEHLTVGYNDVDLCLKVREAGYRVVFTPFAELRHLESVSRGLNVSPQQIERDRQERRYMIERWGKLLQHDPFYSDNLSLANEDFQLAFPPRVCKPWLDGAGAPLWQREQRRLDRALRMDGSRVDKIASAICIVVSSAASFAMFARIATSLLDAKIVPGRIVVADCTDRGATLAQLPGAARLKACRPSIGVELIRDDGQNFSVSRASNIAVRAAGWAEYLLIVTEDAELVPNWFEYMIKAYAGLKGKVVLAARVGLPNGNLEEPVSLQDSRADQVVARATDYDALPAPRSTTEEIVAAEPVVRADRLIAGGVFLGLRDVLCPGGVPLFDERLYAIGREEDLSERLRPHGVRFLSTAASLVSLVRDRPRDIVHFWEHVHDYAWLNTKLAGRPDSGLIEFICPFHRGDVLIGLQVAAQAARFGRPIRMHVAASLMSWVEDFAPDFPVEPIPVPVPPAEQTILNLLRASLHVVQRPDASPRIARSHPMRGLDATDRNLVTAMLEVVGLPASTKLVALRPRPRPEHVQEARRRLAPYGKNVILVHRSGGWDLKTIPDPILRQVASFLKRRGFSLVQIGGPGDEQVPYLDGAITEGLLPLQWAAIFQQSRALVGVDSWSAHFASILDLPQISLYGSTSPRHVNSKAFFAEQSSPSLMMGPVVDCSPCNSLSCLRAPVDFCMGYTFDQQAASAFLDALPTT